MSPLEFEITGVDCIILLSLFLVNGTERVKECFSAVYSGMQDQQHVHVKHPHTVTRVNRLKEIEHIK